MKTKKKIIVHNYYLVDEEDPVIKKLIKKGKIKFSFKEIIKYTKDGAKKIY